MPAGSLCEGLCRALASLLRLVHNLKARSFMHDIRQQRSEVVESPTSILYQLDKKTIADPQILSLENFYERFIRNQNLSLFTFAPSKFLFEIL